MAVSAFAVILKFTLAVDHHPNAGGNLYDGMVGLVSIAPERVAVFTELRN